MTQVLVKAERITRRFGSGEREVVALQATTFAVHPGDRIALLGPSGSGKSTLLNLIAGLDDPTAGRILWPGIGSRDSLRPLAVGMIHQFTALIPTLTVAENVRLPLQLGHRVGQQDKVKQAIAAVGLQQFANQLPDELSGGQAPRAGIARVLAHRPTLLLADEPTGQLDQATGQAMLSTIVDDARQHGTTLMIATHDPAIAERLESVWQMDHGRLITQTSRAAA
jgi:ABC-type lipoprotein export system ATPase subunit